MKTKLMMAIAAMVLMSSSVDAQLITPGTEYTVRVGTAPLTTTVPSGESHTFTGNVVAGVEGPQTIGFLQNAAGENVPVFATETFGPFGAAPGSFEFILSITSEADLSAGTGNTIIAIGSNNTAVFAADPDFGAADPAIEFVPSNAAVVPHIVDTAFLDLFSASGTEIGFVSPITFAAFTDAANNFSAWEGNLGTGLSPFGDPDAAVGEVRMTLFGTILPVPEIFRLRRTLT